MSDIKDYKRPYEAGVALADLCRTHEIGPEWIERSGNLDRLVFQVLEDCDRRLGALPEPVYESQMSSDSTSERGGNLHRIRRLLSFAREASVLREQGETAFSLVGGVDDLERIRQQGPACAEAEYERKTASALELCSEVARLCHKVNNPLTSLIGRSQMLQMKLDPTPERLAKSANVIEESARRVAAVVQELAQVVCRGKEELLKK